MLSFRGSMSIIMLVTRPPTDDDAAHVDPSGQTLHIGDELECPLGSRCSWCSYRWARGGFETVVAVGLKGLRDQADTPGQGAR
jgi:hypothetical protein